MLIHTTSDLGAVVRERRLALRMTQIDLASRAGVSRPTLVRIESGHPRPEMDVVLRIVSALGLAIDAIPEPPAPIDLDALIDSTSSFDACSSSGASVEGGSRG